MTAWLLKHDRCIFELFEGKKKPIRLYGQDRNERLHRSIIGFQINKNILREKV